MVKISYLINSISLILFLISGWSIYSIQADNQNSEKQLSNFNSKIAEITIALEEAKKGQNDRLAREKRKNLESNDRNEALVDEASDLGRKRDELKQEIANNTTKNEELSSAIQKHKVSLARAAVQIDAAKDSVRSISLSIPNDQAEIADLKNQILTENQRMDEVESEIMSYETETNILKNHYELTVSALQKDFYEHPWLDPGERVSVDYSTVDLSSGLLLLPVGKNNGFEQKMRFAVRANGESICQVVIKEVAADHCVASILPLIGNPNKLKEFTKLDLIYL